MTDAWQKLELIVEPNRTDDISSQLFLAGALGVEVQDHSTFGADAVPDGKARIIAFFELDADEPIVDADPTSWRWSRYDDVSWRESWKRFFRPVQLSERVIVGPPWETFSAPPGGHKIVIEPGMAFGTGTHETTALCAGFIDRHFASSTPESLFDIGCGSGILSIAAAKLGCAEILGIDVDPDAVDIAAENARLNGCHAAFSTEWPERTYPFLVANILAHILLNIRESIYACAEPGATLIVSGVTIDQADAFITEFADGHRVVERKQLGEWVAWQIEVCG